MKKLIRKDLKIRQLVNKFENKRLILKSLLVNPQFSYKTKFDLQAKLSSLPRNSSKTRIKNRCVISGRGHGVYSLYKLSRIQLKTLALNADLPGLKKVSW